MRGGVLLLLVLDILSCGGATTSDGPALGTTSAAEARRAAAAEAARDEPPPAGGRLPEGVRPVHYALELDVRPSRARFSGRVAIDVELSRAVRTIWLHGVDLHVTSARVGDAAARWAPVGDDGLAALRLEHAAGPGRVTVTIAFDAAFAPRPGGLFRRQVGGDWYAFSRFTATWARHAFPCFDEPGLEAPFDLAMVVARDDVAIADAPATAEERVDEASKRVRFATSRPLAPHRLSWAVGPLEVVDAPPVPPTGAFARPAIALRGVTTRGRGTEIGTALREAAAGVAALEQTVGGAFAVGSIDLVAIPGESEELLSGDAVAGAVLHDLAARWAAGSVVMPWWDGLWLRESLATWMTQHLLEGLHPELDAGAEDVRRIAWTMGEDALAGARPVHGRVRGEAEIAGAFDVAAWLKGAAVLRTIERWIGTEALVGPLRDPAARPASADAFLAALDAAAGRDVAGPLRSLVDRAGVPIVQVQRQCEGGRASLALRQARWLPPGATARRDRTWKLPVCVTYAGRPGPGHACTVLDDVEGRLDLEGATCAAWVMPNADAAGYYRWALPVADERALLTAAWPALSPRERVAVAMNLSAALSAGTLPVADVLSLLPLMTRARERSVLETPMALLSTAADHLVDDATRPRVHAMGRRLYGPVWARLGWQPPRAARADVQAAILRGEVGRYLALDVEDPTLRTEAAFRGRAALAGGRLHADAVVPELLDTALAVAVQVGDAAFYDATLALLRATEDPRARQSLLAALGRVRDPERVARALDLTLDDGVRVHEAPILFATQMARREGREGAWAWLQEHWEPLHERVGGAWMVAWTAELGSFCEEARAAEIDVFLRPRVGELPGGVASLDRTLETIRLCAAHAEAQREATTRFFRGGR